MCVDHRPWIRQVFSKMGCDISCSNWILLHPLTFPVREAIRLQRRWKGKRQNAMSRAKLGNESALIGPSWALMQERGLDTGEQTSKEQIEGRA
jgi:hypothetical protein